jgi:DNA-binding Xre family transcriptional regulator
MRLRLPELLKDRDMSPYRFAKAMAETGLVSESTAYRLVQERGGVKFDATTLEAICRVFDVEPGELFARERGKQRRPANKRK